MSNTNAAPPMIELLALRTIYPGLGRAAVKPGTAFKLAEADAAQALATGAAIRPGDSLPFWLTSGQTVTKVDDAEVERQLATRPQPIGAETLPVSLSSAPAGLLPASPSSQRRSS